MFKDFKFFLKRIWLARNRLPQKIRDKIVSRCRIKNYSIYLEAIANKKGLEIGGPSDIFKDNHTLPLYRAIRKLDNCNFSNETIWQGKLKQGYFYEFYPGKEKGFQYINDAVDLREISSQTYDFVLACYSLEHFANPLKALKEWLRVLKENGYLILALPHKENTFDHKRKTTSLEHLVKDEKENIGEDDLSHLEEILELHDLSLDPPAGNFENFKKRSLNNFKNRSLHHHVFDTPLVLEMVDRAGLKIISLDLTLPFTILVLAQKTAIVDNRYFLKSAAEYKKTSPFKTDRK